MVSEAMPACRQHVGSACLFPFHVPCGCCAGSDWLGAYGLGADCANAGRVRTRPATNAGRIHTPLREFHITRSPKSCSWRRRRGLLGEQNILELRCSQILSPKICGVISQQSGASMNLFFSLAYPGRSTRNISWHPSLAMPSCSPLGRGYESREPCRGLISIESHSEMKYVTLDSPSHQLDQRLLNVGLKPSQIHFSQAGIAMRKPKGSCGAQGPMLRWPCVPFSR